MDVYESMYIGIVDKRRIALVDAIRLFVVYNVLISMSFNNGFIQKIR